MEPSPILMHTIYAAPVCHSTPISQRSAPLFHVRIDRDGAIVNRCSCSDTGVVGAVSDIGRLAHLASSTRRRWRYALSANDLPKHAVSNHATKLAAERPFLRLHRDEHNAAVAAAVNAVNDLDARLVERGEMQEYPDATGRGPTLFRYTGFDGVQSAHSIPPGRLSPHVRSLLWELAEAVEDEGRR